MSFWKAVCEMFVGTGPVLSWRAVGRVAGLLGLMVAASAGVAQVSIGPSGQPYYAYPIFTPPGVAALTPKLGLSYTGSSVNGPVGFGWSLDGLSAITRCGRNRATDGMAAGVTYSSDDKLCLDGQRLIQTGATGVPGSQSGDAAGLAGMREYRTETDSHARIRAYGYASGTDPESGPARFRVWTKAGEVFDYGMKPDGTNAAGAVLYAQGAHATKASVWGVLRVSERGNLVDAKDIHFVYFSGPTHWGSGTAAQSPLQGREWVISRIHYGNNRIDFSYDSRPWQSPQDAAEAYHLGSKSTNIYRLASVTSSLNAHSITPLAARTLRIAYDNGPVTRRSRIVELKECAGSGTAKCFPPTTFEYASGAKASGASQSIEPSPVFSLTTMGLAAADYKSGVLAADFDLDGKTDILQWTQDANQHQLWMNKGGGLFAMHPKGTGGGQFNIYEQLATDNGCYSSLVIDVNGDGLPDVLRIPAETTPNGNGCGVALHGRAFLNDGNGSFSPVTLSRPDGTPITMRRKTSKAVDKSWDCTVPNQTVDHPCRSAVGWTEGANVHLLDINGDGRLDLVTTVLPAQVPQDPLENPTPGASEGGPPVLGCTQCTKVYLQNTSGQFVETPTNIANMPVYAPPGDWGDLQSVKFAVDINGDGLADLTRVGSPYHRQSWRSNGNGDFTAVSSVGHCDYPLDFNGDGRVDCLFPSADPSKNMLMLADGTDSYKVVSNFNLTSTGQGLSSADDASVPVGSRFGVVVIDVNGDGRSDLLRWHDNAALTELYLSNGDGTFTKSTAAPAGLPIKSSDGTLDFVVGDFSGNGQLEFMRISRDPTNPQKNNQLHLSTVALPADLLLHVTGPTGSKTKLGYHSLANPTAGGVGARYESARQPFGGTSPQKPTTSVIDILPPSYVVSSVRTDNGVGGELTTSYVYAKLKLDTSGRGSLGFGEVRQYSPTALGGTTIAKTEYLQGHPYTGMPRRVEVSIQGLGQPLSVSENVYCDRSAPSGAETAASAAVPCAVPGGTKVFRPYLRASSEAKWDLAGVALPTVSTTHLPGDYGDIVWSQAVTTSVVAGASRTLTSTIERSYQSDISGDQWLVGRMTESKVRNQTGGGATSLLAASAGSAPNAAVTQGSVPPGTVFPVDPAILMPILQMLLD